MKGPLFNKSVSRLSTRDNLGIKGPYTSISRNICEIINTVTPTPFYWCFLTWIRYDAHQNKRVNLHNTEAFFKYLERQDYYFIVSSLLYAQENNIEPGPIVGKDNVIEKIKNYDLLYPVEHKYYSAEYRGMNYYPAGLETSGLFRYKENEQTKMPYITKKGEELALAFEKVIKDTQYYKYYRLNDESVPKDVLLEYANVINIRLDGFDECKKILKEVFFDQNVRKNLCSCCDYINYINKVFGEESFTLKNLRNILFEKSHSSLPEQLQDIAKSWEIAIGREYFTLGIEIIWQQLTRVLNASPMNKKTWIAETLKKQKDLSYLEMNVSEYLKTCVYEFDKREDLIYHANREKEIVNNSLTDGLGIMLESYNRFYQREDFSELHNSFLDEDHESISLKDWFDLVNKYSNKTVKELLEFIMENYCIFQHYKTAINKLSYNIDGFYYELSDKGTYFFKLAASVDFRGNRLLQLHKVMKDLDMIEV